MSHSAKLVGGKKLDQDVASNHVSEYDFNAFVDGEGLKNRVLESPKSSYDPEQAVYIITRDGHHACAVCLAPVTYNDGAATEFDPHRKSVYQVQYFGYRSIDSLNLGISLILRATENGARDHLVIVKTQYNELVTTLASQGFVRVSGISNPTKTYALLNASQDETISSGPSEIPATAIPFDDIDHFYYHELARQFSFDLTALIQKGWTVYKRDERSFLFTVTFGMNRHLQQPAFRVDVYDCQNGMFTGYNDVHVPEDSDSVFNDVPAIGFSSVVPDEALEYLPDTSDVAACKADWTRGVWKNRDALWVHPQNRNQGIGRSLERVACDISRYLYTDKQLMQVCVHFENPEVYYFHERNGARKIRNGLYRLAYNLVAGERPLLSIIQHSR